LTSSGIKTNKYVKGATTTISHYCRIRKWLIWILCTYANTKTSENLDWV